MSVAPLTHDMPLLCNLEAEAALLSSLMGNGMGWLIEYAADRLTAGSFFEPGHGRIFDAIQHQHALGKPATPIFIKGHIESDESLRELGGVQYLAQLTANMNGMFAPRDLVDQIADFAQRRRMRAGLLTAADACADLDATTSEIVAHADAALAAEARSATNSVSAGEAIGAFLRDQEQQASGVITGSIPSNDRLLGPMKPGQMIIAAARPGMGKTALAVSAGTGAAKRGHGVLYVSLEMSAKEIAGRMLADMCFDGDDPIPYAAIRDGRLNPAHQRRVIAAESEAHGLPFQIVDAGSLTVGRLNTFVRRHARRMAAQGRKLELVIVDYLQLLQSDTKGRSNYETVSEISRSLKAMAKDHGVVVLALAQLSREVEKRPDKRPLMSDLRDSGQIEQDADAVLLLLRNEHYLNQSEPGTLDPARTQWEAAMDAERGRLEIILAKRRNGRTGSAVVQFHAQFQAVRG